MGNPQAMASLALCGTGGRTPIQNPTILSASTFVAPLSIRFPRRKKNAALIDNPRRKYSRTSVSLNVKPPDQNRQRFYSYGSPPPGKLPSRVFVGYTVYKGKAALTVEPRPPEFHPLGSGAIKLSKEGCVLLQFAPALGVRQYDWDKKQVFSLSVTEIGQVISLGASDSCEFFHDPNMGRSDEGKVKKVLKVEPLPDGSGHFFNLSVQNKLADLNESIYIPITKAEFAVLASSFNFIIPYLLGWYAFANSLKLEDSRHGDTRYVDFEWSR